MTNTKINSLRVYVTLSLIIFAILLFGGSRVFATDDGTGSGWSEGKIGISVGIATKDKYRNTWQYPYGGNIAWVTTPYYSSAEVELLDSENNVVGSFANSHNHTFENLPAGKYRLRLSLLDKGIYHVLKGVVNGTASMTNLITGEYSDWIEIAEGDGTVKNYYAVIEYKAYGLKTTTDVGHFENGDREKTYYRGTNSTFTINGIIYNTHDGIYYGDSADLYEGMNQLEIPELSDEEASKGYYFKGWQIEGDSSGKIYTTIGALSVVARSDLVFKAIWGYPTHSVTFSTNSAMGSIDGGVSYSYRKDYNDQTVDVIPHVTPKEGFEFIGWFNDLTINTIPEDEIKSTTVDRDLHYYAKYRKVLDTPVNTTTTGTTTTVTDSPSYSSTSHDGPSDSDDGSTASKGKTNRSANTGDTRTWPVALILMCLSLICVLIIRKSNNAA